MQYSTDDEEQDFRDYHQAANRKGKKPGGWQSIGLDHPVFKGIERKGYQQPTPIQRKCIPCILDGKDVVGMSRTGSGKTAAFVIPMLQKLKARDVSGIRALLVSPTRELALQTFKVVKDLGRFTGLRCAILVGGDSIEDQFSVIHENPDILVATPGRLLHVVMEMDLKLKHVNYVVFDEADRLFEMGFEQQLIETMKRIPESRQTLLFSATLPKMLVDFAKAGLSEPMLVRLDVDEKISEKLSMVFLACRAEEKLETLLTLCRDAINTDQLTAVFCATMKHVEYVVALLSRAGIEVSFVYSQLDATARKMNIARFHKKETKILVVTDVAARGIDIPLLDMVINLHFPARAKLFVHRVGRVARAGRTGTAISLLAPDELPYLCDLYLFMGKPMKYAKDDDKYDENETLIGRVPHSLISVETDFLIAIHDNNADLADLKHKSKNAMAKYTRTRPPPSAESARRAKNEVRELAFEAAPHPFLCSESDQQQNTLLRQLSSFKAKSTIFEVRGADKTEGFKIMQTKRKEHQVHIADTKEKKQKDRASREELEATRPGDAEQADDYLLSATFTEVIGPSGTSSTDDGTKRKKRDRTEERRIEKEKHYVHYQPKDYQSERQLAVDKVDFSREASHATVDICADEEDGMNRQQSQKRRWDRKLKKYVTSEDGPKKIRTEEGVWIPITYKSGRYEDWKKKQKMAYRRDQEVEDVEGGDRGDEESGGPARKKPRKVGPDDYSKFNPKPRFSKERTDQDNLMKQKRKELKGREEILKTRVKKDKLQSFMKWRRQVNTERREKHAKRGGGGGGKGKKAPA